MPGTFNRSLSIEQLECRRLLAFNPTAQEQEMLQLINRFRTDPQGEFNRLFSSATTPPKARDPTIDAEVKRNNVHGVMLRNEWAALSPVEPLVWNEAVYNFGASHNAEMIRQNRPFHSTNAARRAALIAAGVDLISDGEVIVAKPETPLHAYAAYVVNWGANADTGGTRGGMQEPRMHRELLINPAFDQVGLRTTNTSVSNLRPRVNTTVLADTRDARLMVVGAVFEDKNNNGWYEAGEGRGNVTIRFEKTTGEQFTTKSLSAGGYQIELPAGIYKVRATGGGMQHAVVQTITVADNSLWRNLIYRPTDPAPDAQEPNNTRGTATRLTGASPSLNGLSLHADNDVDFFRYVAERTGSATFQVQFSHAQGNIDLELQNSTGQVLARSTGSGNTESIARQVEAGSVYFVRVYGKANPSYALASAAHRTSIPTNTSQITRGARRLD